MWLRRLCALAPVAVLGWCALLACAPPSAWTAARECAGACARDVLHDARALWASHARAAAPPPAQALVVPGNGTSGAPGAADACLCQTAWAAARTWSLGPEASQFQFAFVMALGALALAYETGPEGLAPLGVAFAGGYVAAHALWARAGVGACSGAVVCGLAVRWRMALAVAALLAGPALVDGCPPLRELGEGVRSLLAPGAAAGVCYAGLLTSQRTRIQCARALPLPTAQPFATHSAPCTDAGWTPGCGGGSPEVSRECQWVRVAYTCISLSLSLEIHDRRERTAERGVAGGARAQGGSMGAG